MKRSLRWLSVVIHAVVVGALLAAFALLYATHTGPDANIGLGLVGLPLLLLGLPWTLHYLIDPDVYAGLGGPLRSIIVLGPAVLNVGIHALIVGLSARRSRRVHQP
ncbi:MAG TPA: hypothetical protein VFX61_14080 [Micromonosporaceae bacterium]|nr:hypothetical protein [Micromonosporaceae bacterium]